ncbi:hypothetical protein Q3G72_007484 [Acer saccharum]|nr:hypothetical protein Q3G72_007484 [Acer saccharum]
MFKIKNLTICYPTLFRLGCHQKPKPWTISFKSFKKFNGIELVRTPTFYSIIPRNNEEALQERKFKNGKEIENEDAFVLVLQREAERLMKVTPKFILSTLVLMFICIMLSVFTGHSKVYFVNISLDVHLYYAIGIYSLLCVMIVIYEMKHAEWNVFIMIVVDATLLFLILVVAKVFKVSFSEVFIGFETRFKVNDFIKGKSFEGQVIDMSLTETTPLDSNFSEMIIVSKINGNDIFFCVRLDMKMKRSYESHIEGYLIEFLTKRVEEIHMDNIDIVKVESIVSDSRTKKEKE